MSALSKLSPPTPRLGNILVVDDDEQVRDYLQDRLREEGYSCAVAADGSDAIRQLRDVATPDVILLDLEMPGLDGIEFLQLAQNSIGPHFGVIVMSGRESPRIREQIARLGAATMLLKPIDFDRLLRLIRIQLDFRRTRSSLGPPAES